MDQLTKSEIMKLFNTLSRSYEEINPLKDKVTIYTCGPTVYDRAHIGNLRTYLFEDLMKRALQSAGFKTRHVMNITDIDDKTIKKSHGIMTDHEKLTREYEEAFFEDLYSLNITRADVVTRATAYIDEMVALVQQLLESGYAYRSEDGSIYFAIDKFKHYGKLSGLDKEGIKAGARVKQDEYDKENPADFALWKAWDEADGEIYWDTPLGKGRPGWHIECSAMAGKELGETIDIHAGAVDLIFPHHENEIAQSEAKSGKQFARYWIHGEHLLVDNQKMSKSLQNFYTMQDIIDKGFDPLDFRYLCLQAHYRTKLNFTWASMTAARNARLRLARIASELSEPAKAVDFEANHGKDYLQMFKERIEDDLNMPEALAVMWEMLRDDNLDESIKRSILYEIDGTILGLGLDQVSEEEVPSVIQNWLLDRAKAKDAKDYDTADQLRQKIEESGWCVEDSPGGSKAVRK